MKGPFSLSLLLLVLACSRCPAHGAESLGRRLKGLRSNYEYEQISIFIDPQTFRPETREHFIFSVEDNLNVEFHPKAVLEKTFVARRKSKHGDNPLATCKARLGRPRGDIKGDWNLLWVESSEMFNADNREDLGEREKVFYCAGYAEGMLSAEEIYKFHRNMYADWFTDYSYSPTAKFIYDFLEKNYDYMRDMLTRKSTEDDEYWQEVALIMKHLDGMYDGYNDARKREEHSDLPEMTIIDLLFLSADGDVQTLETLERYQKDHPDLDDKSSNGALRSRRATKRFEFGTQHEVRCSALLKTIKSKDDNGKEKLDVLVGHTTWDHFENMAPRFLKSFQIHGLPSHSYTMSSSPGMLSSVDDFFLTGNKLVIIETTNDMFNTSLLKLVKPESVLSWVRARVANTQKTVSDWGDMFERHNSGTYNNQWMVISAPHFLDELNAKVPEKIKWFLVMEQLPGFVKRDMMDDHLLDKGYWASFNVPYFDEIMHMANYTQKQADDVRGRIFPREIKRVEKEEGGFDMKSFKALMRYNKYDTDPLAKGDPCEAISSRCDLNPLSAKTYKASGGLDCKVVSLRELVDGLNEAEFQAQLGPTFDDQPVFTWSGLADKLTAEQYNVPTHLGHPDRFEFNWVTFGPFNISDPFVVTTYKDRKFAETGNDVLEKESEETFQTIIS